MMSSAKAGTFAATWRNYVRILVKNAVLILLLAVVGGAAAAGYLAMKETRYSSSVTLLAANAARVPTFMRLVSTDSVLEPAVKDAGVGLDAQQAASMVAVANPQGSMLVTVTVTSPDADVPQPLANAIGDSLAEQAAVIEESLSSNVGTPLSVVQSARPAAPAAARSVAATVGLASAIGAILGVAVAFLRDIRGTRIGSRREIRTMSDLPVAVDLAGSGGASVSADRARRLRFVGVDASRQVYVVGLVGGGDSKAVAAAAQAAAEQLAEADRAVLLIDASFGRHSLSDDLAPEEGAGLSDVLLGDCALTEATVTPTSATIDFLPAGHQPPNSVQLVASDSMGTLLREASSIYSYVVVALPEGVQPTTTDLPWAVEAVLLPILTLGRTTRRDLQAFERLRGPARAGLVISESHGVRVKSE